jgi:hypothetical protein
MALRLLLALVIAAVSLQAQDAALLILHKGSSSLGFYTDDGKLLARVPVGAHPHEMVLSSDGRYVYTTDNGTMKIEQAGTGGNTVSIIDIPGRKKVGEISTGKFRRPHGIDLDRKTGNLLVSCELPDQRRPLGFRKQQQFFQCFRSRPFQRSRKADSHRNSAGR